MQRRYLVVRPVDVGADERPPTVMVLHGLTVDRFAMAPPLRGPGGGPHRFVAVFPRGSCVVKRGSVLSAGDPGIGR